MNRLLLIIAVACFAVSLAAAAAQAELFGDFVGYTACGECHPKIVEGWKTTPHARAFEDLKHQGEEKQSVPGCVRCHVVAMDAEGGFIDMDLTPELKDVQCESCHGPGLAHSQSGDPADLKVHPDEALCRTCHTEGQDKNFDYKVKSRFVHGGE
ncbi:cytochrome c family protein [Desulfovibrio sp. Fe33]|uniref:cytochrome c family protein n=1 Tax=Desulfovibrio sp. Fe33 TaxID=3020842 RepID=UPI00234DC60E|nr:cytochrome c family protein [Desulfovibrio sp. Fe33]